MLPVELARTVTGCLDSVGQRRQLDERNQALSSATLSPENAIDRRARPAPGILRLDPALVDKCYEQKVYFLKENVYSKRSGVYNDRLRAFKSVYTLRISLCTV